MQHFRSSQALAQPPQPGRGSKAICQRSFHRWEALAGKWESRHNSQAQLTVKHLKKSMENKSRNEWNGLICLDKSMASQIAILATGARCSLFWLDPPIVKMLLMIYIMILFSQLHYPVLGWYAYINTFWDVFIKRGLMTTEAFCCLASGVFWCFCTVEVIFKDEEANLRMDSWQKSWCIGQWEFVNCKVRR